MCTSVMETKPHIQHLEVREALTRQSRPHVMLSMTYKYKVGYQLLHVGHGYAVSPTYHNATHPDIRELHSSPARSSPDQDGGQRARTSKDSAVEGQPSCSLQVLGYAHTVTAPCIQA